MVKAIKLPEGTDAKVLQEHVKAKYALDTHWEKTVKKDLNEDGGTGDEEGAILTYL